MHERELYEQGIAEFNAGRYFDCHDTLEELWMETRGERRRYLQGLIQAAVGLYHASSGNLTGAHSQLTKSLEKLSAYPVSYLGVDVTALVEELEAVYARIVSSLMSGEVFNAAELPLIHYRFDAEAMSDLE